MNIYFYTIKPILPNQELLVWYCREFAERLNYPLTGELMLQRIRKSMLELEWRMSIVKILHLYNNHTQGKLLRSRIVLGTVEQLGDY